MKCHYTIQFIFMTSCKEFRITYLSLTLGGKLRTVELISNYLWIIERLDTFPLEYGQGGKKDYNYLERLHDLFNEIFK